MAFSPYQKPKRGKKLVIRLIIAAAVLILCGVVIFLFARRNSTGSTPDPTTPEATQPPTTVIHYAAAGDLNVNALTVEAGGSGYDYTNAFLDVAHLLGKADVATINFEGNLCGEPYGSTNSAPQQMAVALQKMGVDLVQMANSYAIHRGLSGLATSIDAVRSAGMEPLGVYATKADFQAGKGYTIRNVQGVKMAFVAFTKGMQEGATIPGDKSQTGDLVNVLYEDYDSTYQKINKDKITAVLSAAKKEKPDIIIALLHWGSEETDPISKTQNSIVELMQANGVDAIIGTHPHRVQKIDFNRETGKVVAYSLGDFFANAAWVESEQRYVVPDGSEYSVVLDLEITKDLSTGKAKITNCTYTPIFTIHEEKAPMRIVRIREAIAAYESGYLDKVSEETYKKLTYAMQRIEARVAGE